jgi:multiple sugar transport system substrate-binding protein
MKSMSRRYFLYVSSAITAGALLEACGGSAATLTMTKLRWWDHFAPLGPMHKAIFANYMKQHSNVTIEYQTYNLPQLGQSLQLAFNSKQAPDVHSIASLNVPTPKLVESGWFTPLEDHVSAAFKDRFPKGVLLEGLHIFNGKLYSFPLFSYRSNSTLIWFNKDLMADAGADPATGPKTWDEFRQVARKMTKNGKYGWVQTIQLADRLGEQVNNLAQTAGAAGGIDWKTGAYIYHTDPYIRAIEFMLAMQKDGSLFPASTSLDARSARARFSTGIAGMFFDGPWCIGVINKDYKAFADKVNVGQIPVPDGNKASYTYHDPNGGDFWINSQSKHPEIAGQLLENFNTEEYYIKLAEGMDQPPLDLKAVEKANVHPTYKQALKYFEESVRLAPSPVVKNPVVAQVQAAMKDVRPNLGEIAQGVLGGTIKDYKAALKSLSDKLTAEREKAIKTVQAKGEKVSLDDWAFSNWDSSKDYTADSYQK